MSRAVITALALLLAAPLLASADADADADAAKPDRAAVRSGCVPKRGKSTIFLRTRTAVLFDREKRGEEGTFTVAYGCDLREGKRVKLGVDDVDFNESITQWKVAGRYVAFVTSAYEDLGSSVDAVRVVDLQTGRRRASPAAETTVRRLVVTPTGAVAWSSEVTEGDAGEPADAPELKTVTKLDADGLHALDCGAGIAVASLRLRGSEVSLQSGGQVRTWTLNRPVAEQVVTPTDNC